MLPEAVAVCRGGPMDVLVPVAGVLGGAPPATVDMEYCCPCKNELLKASTMKIQRKDISC
jgi:hypothetical protein